MNQRELCAQLSDVARIRQGEVLMVHSSYKSLGPVDGGPATVVAALQHAVSPEGTLLMPVFTYPTPEGVFHLQTSPSRTGIITETFRTTPDVRRSRHPTHSVAAWGRRADEFLSGHPHTSGLGPESPFHRAALAGSSVLMIGCHMTACSLLHVAEALARVPYLGRVCYPGYERTLIVDDDAGQRTEVPSFNVPTDSNGFNVVEEEMERKGLLVRFTLGEAECLKFFGKYALLVAASLLQRDPAALLCHNPNCSVCTKARELVGARHTP